MYNSIFMTWRDQAELWKHLWYYTVLKIRDPFQPDSTIPLRNKCTSSLMSWRIKMSELLRRDTASHEKRWNSGICRRATVFVWSRWSDQMECYVWMWILCHGCWTGGSSCRVSQPFFCGADTLHILRHWLPTLFYNLQRNITVILLKLLHIKWLWLSEIPHISLTGFPYLTNATVLPSKIPRQVKLWSLFSPLEVYT